MVEKKEKSENLTTRIMSVVDLRWRMGRKYSLANQNTGMYISASRKAKLFIIFTTISPSITVRCYITRETAQLEKF